MSTDPKLTRTSVQIKYSSSDGFRFEYGAKAGTGTKHRVTGEEVPSQHALLEALGELARLTALFGFEAEALKEFNGARQRVAEWREKRNQSTGAPT